VKVYLLQEYSCEGTTLLKIFAKRADAEECLRCLRAFAYRKGGKILVVNRFHDSMVQRFGPLRWGHRYNRVASILSYDADNLGITEVKVWGAT